MRKLILATVAAASLLGAGAALTSQPAHAAWRCWWTGPVRHCAFYRPGWWWRYHHPVRYHPWWWYRHPGWWYSY